MNIQLHIERLVLDGVGDFDFAERHLLETAVALELARLLQMGGLEVGAGNGRALATLTGPAITLTENQPVQGVGQEIGRAVYGAVSGERPQ